MQSSAQTTWTGSSKAGRGRVSTQSGRLSDVGFADPRFGNDHTVLPGELLAAAHSACFSMSLTYELGVAGIVPKQISADASVQTNVDGVTLTYTAIHLTVRAQVERSQEEAVREAAALARDTCPIARALKTPVTMDLQFDR
jgi:osmotically inducible protein OsmC